MMRNRSVHGVLGVLIAVVIASAFGCRAPSSESAPTAAGFRHSLTSSSIPGEHWLRTELYFGLTKRTGEVTDAEWAEFVANEITPRFPAGLTIVGGYGQWRTSSGRIQKESSRVMILLHSPDAAVNEKIEALRSIWCQQFQQESVLRVTSQAIVSFSVTTNEAPPKVLLVK